MIKPQIRVVEQLASTNTYMAEHSTEFEHGGVLCARSQTAGRGQRGNSWEAEPGKNLTFTLMMRDFEVPVQQQFVISMAVSIAMVKTLRRYTDGILVKWPNDIYYRDSKLCGILIENTLMGNRIMQSLAGIGLNVNQHRFVSNAPNPISLFQILGHEVPLDKLLEELNSEILRYVEPLREPGYEVYANTIHQEYAEMLYRGDGRLYSFRRADDSDIMASIERVDADGRMTLRLADGTVERFYFKEVAFVI